MFTLPSTITTKIYQNLRGFLIAWFPITVILALSCFAEEILSGPKGYKANSHS